MAYANDPNIEISGIMVDDMGVLQTAPIYRTRVEWYNGLAAFNGRSITRIQGDDDTRKIDIGKQRHGKFERGKQARYGEHQQKKQDGAAMRLHPTRHIHGWLSRTIMPSCNS